MILSKIRSKIYKTKIGLLPDKPDNRDIQVGLLWGLFTKYEPKHNKKILTVRKAKDQFCNTCGWNSATGMKEIDEKEDLDERSLVIFGKLRGYVSGDGFSMLRNNQKTLLKDGIAPKGMLESGRTSWNEYCDPKYLTEQIKQEAAKRKIKSYALINNIDEIYKAIDDGRPVQIGVDWYTGWNMSGGFKLPWIAYKIIGYLAGGHAMYVYGYDLDYKGQKVFIVRNSFGNSYGNNGDLYITPEILAPNIIKYGAFINHDLDVDIARWIEQHNGKVVKSSTPDVYLIEAGKKRKFPDEAVLLVHGIMIEEIINVSSEYLDKVPVGDDMNFWDGMHVKSTKEVIRIAKDKNLENIFKNYFEELL